LRTNQERESRIHSRRARQGSANEPAAGPAALPQKAATGRLI
jgi:hypothetical protein